jgi:DHA2 family multidrug resistance protein-like MFS transporter
VTLLVSAGLLLLGAVMALRLPRHMQCGAAPAVEEPEHGEPAGAVSAGGETAGVGPERGEAAGRAPVSGEHAVPSQREAKTAARKPRVTA